MTLPQVAFVNDVAHAKGTVQTSPNKPYKPKTQKPLKIEFSDSDSGNDLPIPYLREEESEYSEDFPIDPTPTFIRKGVRRPVPRRCTVPNIKKSSTQTQFSLPTSGIRLPRPPAPPQNTFNPPRPAFIRHIKTKSQLDAEKNSTTEVKNDEKMNDNTNSINDNNSHEESSSEYTEENINQGSSPKGINQLDENINEGSSPKETNQLEENIKETSQLEENIKETSQFEGNLPISKIKSEPTFSSSDIYDSEKLVSPLSPRNDSFLSLSEPACYFIEKKVVSKMMKNKVAFTLRQGTTSLISTVVNTHNESAQITYEQSKFTILMESSQNSYSLRIGESYGEELFSILYSISIVPFRHKYCVLRFFQKIANIPIRLQSQLPKLKPNGELDVSFGSRQAIPSIKNMIFVDQKKQEYLSVMKIAKTTLCIELPPEIPPYIAFIIGMSAFLNHSK